MGYVPWWKFVYKVRMSSNKFSFRYYLYYMEDEVFPELPPGYRFLPTDVELVKHYLLKKELSMPVPGQVFQDIDARELYSKHPKGLVTFPNEEREWFFFIYEDENSHLRSKTKTRVVENGGGFWKSWKEEDPIYDADGNIAIALKTNLTYFSASSSEPKKTHWTMQEYRIRPVGCITEQTFEGEGWVLCRLKRGKREYKSSF